jgi:surface protein
MLPNLSALSQSSVGAPTPPPQPGGGGGDGIPYGVLAPLVERLLADDPANACANLARFCATQRGVCDDAVFRGALLTFGLPPTATLPSGVPTWREWFGRVCADEATLRAAGGWMRKGVTRWLRDWGDDVEPFQLHAAARRAKFQKLPGLRWLLEARGGDPAQARPAILDGAALQAAVRAVLPLGAPYVHPTFGPIREWNVSNVRKMSDMFYGASRFNGDLSHWDVSNVTRMGRMFVRASSFNGDLSRWDVSNVRKMSDMFDAATSFNGDLSGWDVSSVDNMTGMFEGATSFNGDLSRWDVRNVTQMPGMFYGATSFNGDLSGWDVSNVDNMAVMFHGATSFNGDLSGWKVGNVTDMDGMFEGATRFNGDLRTWDVRNVANMDLMFAGATSFNGNLSTWDVRNVRTMLRMFEGATSYNPAPGYGLGERAAWREMEE